VFLPGAVGDPGFWSPVARRLPADWEKVALGWPGLGDQPHDRLVRGLDDLVALVVATLARPSDLAAQSMGGVVAVQGCRAASADGLPIGARRDLWGFDTR
jgi:surfactin synthase thioesterase subunit